jgi:hypothetical protein
LRCLRLVLWTIGRLAAEASGAFQAWAALSSHGTTADLIAESGRDELSFHGGLIIAVMLYRSLPHGKAWSFSGCNFSLPRLSRVNISFWTAHNDVNWLFI